MDRFRKMFKRKMTKDERRFERRRMNFKLAESEPKSPEIERDKFFKLTFKVKGTTEIRDVASIHPSRALLFAKRRDVRVDFNSKLGEGSFGTVYEGMCKGRKAAYKLQAIRSEKNPNQEGTKELRLVYEVTFWNKLNGHPFIVELLDCFLIREEVWIVMEYAEEGDLFHEIFKNEKKRLEIEEARKFFRQICLGLNHIHAMGLAHRDMKLDNVLLFKDRYFGGRKAKITDFGLTTIAWHENVGIILQLNWSGTLRYMPPEILFQQYGRPTARQRPIEMAADETTSTKVGPQRQRKEEVIGVYREMMLRMERNIQHARDMMLAGPLMVHRDYLERKNNAMCNDCWAMGIILFAMVTGSYPFHRTEEGPEGLADLMIGKVRKIRFMQADCRQYIRTMLEANPVKRANIKCMLNHDYLRDQPFARQKRRRAPPNWPFWPPPSSEPVATEVKEVPEVKEGPEVREVPEVKPDATYVVGPAPVPAKSMGKMRPAKTFVRRKLSAVAEQPQPDPKSLEPVLNEVRSVSEEPEGLPEGAVRAEVHRPPSRQRSRSPDVLELRSADVGVTGTGGSVQSPSAESTTDQEMENKPLSVAPQSGSYRSAQSPESEPSVYRSATSKSRRTPSPSSKS